MEHESTKLTAQERRILAEIEVSLEGEKRRMIRDRLRWPSPALRWISWAGALIGSAVLAGGLWFGAVVVAATGFVVLLVGLSRLLPDGIAGWVRSRVHRLRKRGNAPPDDTS